MEAEGFKVAIVSLAKGSIKSWNDENWSTEYDVNETLDTVKA
jgi:protease I